MNVFDRQLLKIRRNRHATRIGEFDFLLQDTADSLLSRLGDIKKEFPIVLDLGGRHGILARKLEARAGTSFVVTSDLSTGLLRQGEGGRVAADEEFLPFASGSLDAVVSNMALHWVNDLPGALVQIRNALKPDGLFLAAMAGGETLKELRECLMEAELEVTGGVSPRVSPFADMRDMGGLLQRAGFALPVVDSDKITVSYSSPFKLLENLRGIGGSNALLARLKTPTRRRVILEAMSRYVAKYADESGFIPATIDVIYLIGWAPHASQQKPLKPGSAQARLADALKSPEMPAGEKTGR